MEKFVINGGVKLSGKLRAESAKNAVLPILAASVLTDEEVVIKNCPAIADVLSMIKILNFLGVKTEFQDGNLIVNASGMSGYAIPYSLGKELRSSVFMMGALVSRFKKARLSYPGGCDIGARPVDLHLKGLEKLGVGVCEDDGTIECFTDRVKGTRINLSFPSVGATENLMLA
ncbi:MAG: UDP-N-acetylglucosamine 1-carboxyvinyltransferase, partial [Clostridia bacterium]|nr:UDP-N-acetylglucosamine 1-carboxyvinyltransferase [Clostridia bacterium]